jgi:predicted RecB family nuclease
MTMQTLRTCERGHKYYKSNDCPTCPICEAQKKPQDGFLSLLSAPARRALENNGITTIEQLSNYSAKELMTFHGFGKSSLPKLRIALEEKRLTLK